MSEPIRVCVTRRFDASPERVFDAWLSPDLIGRWMFGPLLREEEVLRIALDPRVGRGFSFLVRRQGHDIDHVGTYLEIDRPRRLVFTWAIAPDSPEPGKASRVVISIVALAAGCELTLTHEMQPQWADYAPRVEAGWTKMLDTLAMVLK